MTCPTCKGSGMDGSTYVPATHLTPSEIDPCGMCNGSGLDKTRLEAAAKALLHEMGGSGTVGRPERMAAAAIRAYLDHTEET